MTAATAPAGRWIGHYEVLELIGAGGMGQVYRARDSRLGREVALKVLPAELVQDPARRRRLEAEARAAGRLSHPHVLAVLELGFADAEPYLVTELLQGRTLGACLKEGPLPVDKALDLAGQLADALAAAHAQGIVHRDLKPDNVFLCADGRLKVLDFGLAGPGPAEDLPAGDPTPVTAPGLALGTPGYAAPEQLRGEPVDGRADLFALGAVLYEMLAGRRAFPGATPAERIGAVLRDDPPPLPHLPAPVGRVLLRCLQRRPEERFQSARDLGFALQAVRAGTSPEPAPARRRWPALLALLAAGAAATAFRPRRAPAPPPSYERLTFRRGTLGAARFDPAARAVVYAAAWDGAAAEVFTTRPGSVESRRLGVPAAHVLAVSPDGRLRLLQEGGGRSVLSEVPLSGGGLREVAEGVDWGDVLPDGRLVVARAQKGRYRLEAPPGAVVYESAGGLGRLRAAPRGARLAFFEHPVEGDNRGSLRLLDLDTGAVSTLAEGWSALSGLAWAGDEVWFSASRGRHALYAVRPGGAPRLLLEAPSDLVLHDVGADGAALVAQVQYRQSLRALAGGEDRDLSWLDGSALAALSADGAQVLFNEQGEGGGSTRYAVYVRGLAGEEAVRLGEGRAHALSPDGRCVLATLPDPAPAPLALLATGTAACPAPPASGLHHLDGRWLAAAGPLVLAAREGGGAPRLFLQPLDGPPRPLTAEGFRLARGAAVSPDATRLAALDPAGRLVLLPVAGGEPQPVAGARLREDVAGWGGDGGSLLLFTPGQKLPAEVTRLELATGARARAALLPAADRAGLRGLQRVLCTADARTCVYSFARSLSDLFLVRGLR